VRKRPGVRGVEKTTGVEIAPTQQIRRSAATVMETILQPTMVALYCWKLRGNSIQNEWKIN
jgi:hypothetical protein